MPPLRQQIGRVLFTSNLPTIEAALQRDIGRRLRMCAIEVRNEWLLQLTGERHGRLYLLPTRAGATARRARSKNRPESGPGSRGGHTYRASAPGEPPASRFGRLRQSISYEVEMNQSEGVAYIGSQVKYSIYLELGTRNMAPRPSLFPAYMNAIPEIKRILQEPMVL
jgi:hypothetical protein